MARRFGLTSPAALGLGLVLAVGTSGFGDEPKDLPPGSAPPPKTTSETIGNSVGNVVESIKRGARVTTESLQEQYQRARNSVHDMGIQSRVYSRLHWDKNLADCRIDIEIQGGTATLRGTVKSLAAKAKALELAHDTTGVDRVEDRLTIEPPATPTEKVRG
jgi:hyperosmotically inducible protein